MSIQGIQLNASSDAGLSSRAQVFNQWRNEINQLKGAITPVFEDNPRMQSQLTLASSALESAFNPSKSTGSRVSSLMTSINSWKSLAPDIAKEDSDFMAQLKSDSFLKASPTTGKSVASQIGLLHRAGVTTQTGLQVKNAHFTGSATMTDSLKKELEGLIRGLLENGIEDLGELGNILLLVGALGGKIDSDLIQQVKLGLKDFINQQAGSKTSLEDFLSLLNLIKSMSSGDLGTPLVDEGDIASRHFQNQLQITTVAPSKTEITSDGTEIEVKGVETESKDARTGQKSVSTTITTTHTTPSKIDKKSDDIVTQSNPDAQVKKSVSSNSSSSSDSGDNRGKDRGLGALKADLDALLDDQITAIASELFNEITGFMHKQLDRQADRIIDLTPIAEAEEEHEDGIVV